MDALVMCGGEGTRLDADVEKPLFEVAGAPMIDRVLDALADSRIDETRAVTSPATPRTREHLVASSLDTASVDAASDDAASDAADVTTIDAPGDGYVADLQYALERVDRPVLTVVADLPLLDGTVVDDVLARYAGESRTPSMTVCVPASLKRTLGASVDTTVEATTDGETRSLAPTGVNVVGRGDGESTLVSWDVRLAVNVNRNSDADRAEELL